MLSSAARSWWAEPRAPDAPQRVWRDWALVAAFVTSAVVEAIVRDDVVWRPVALVVAVALTFPLLWRRTHPLAATVVVFGTVTLVDLAALVANAGVWGLYSNAFVLLFPYALVRWGSGRDVVVGMPVILTTFVVSVAGDFTGVADAVGGLVVLLFPAALGAAVRYRTGYRQRDRDQVRLQERERLAREVHDSVAHHVSGIAIRAQAGQVLAASDPAAAVDALEVIEAEASRTLSELRRIVGILREGEQAELAPQPGVADIAKLAGIGDQPRVDVSLTGPLDDLGPSVAAALYRIAQESITNAVRHARHATRIDVRVAGGADVVGLTVEDDGDAAAGAGTSAGYGLAGMAERVTLLGGTLDAGPGPGRGWTVRAVIPKAGTGA